jgi:hypothetical protein
VGRGIPSRIHEPEVVSFEELIAVQGFSECTLPMPTGASDAAVVF